MITETNLLKENRIKFRRWLDNASRGNKPEYKNHLVDVLEHWLDEKLEGFSVGNLFRFESKDVSEFLQLAKKIYEHPSYTGENGIDWKDRHNAPSAAISNYYKYLGFEGNWKKDIYATDPFGIKNAYIEKKFDKEIQKEDGDFKPKCTMQTIFFGAPGTGKSHKIDYNLFKDKDGNPIGKGIKEIPEDRKFRTTFHPDYDYAQFVGAYKPQKLQNNDNGLLSEEQLAQRLSKGFPTNNNEKEKTIATALFGLQYFKSLKDKTMAKIVELSGVGNSKYIGATLSAVVKARVRMPDKENEISYSFVPQVFAKAYAAAWKLYLQRDSRLRGNDDKNGENDSGKDIQVFLVIEEINRGNCAQIFGDIFQLLDRDEKGFSQYSIDADYDFADWLKTNEEYGLKKDWELYVKFHYEKDGKTINPVSDTKIALPPNLNILATMNTSDQSLFPMDSAFKRRFDWEYVSINYEKAEADFIVGDASFNFKWLDFLKKVNADIYKVTQSEDKQMGEFFIKPKNKDYVTLDEFRSKVLFYLWDSVYKDELDSKLVFHFAYPEKGPDVTFQRLFNGDFVEILKKMLANLDDKYKDGAQQG